MRLPRLLTVAVAVVALGAILAVAQVMANWDPRLLRDVKMELPEITPNADGQTDATPIQYWLARNANVSIYFTDANGRKFYFRHNERRSVSRDEPYRVLFSGVVEGFTRRGENIVGQVESRVLPDGDYAWVIEATDDRGHAEQATGRLTIRDADTKLPELRAFTVFPPVFTPNRDGISDRVRMNFDLSKDVDPERLQVYVESSDGKTQVYVPEQQDINLPGKTGLHTYDWAAGVDQGATPPPDGKYMVVAKVEDRVGQKTQVTSTLTIQNGGVPRAYIIAQPDGRSVEWSAHSVAIDSTVYFTLTVENIGNTPIRTTGPEPGTVYDYTQNYATLGWTEESGAWRVGINCDACLRDHPWRWAVGTAADLTTVDGYSYLLPGHRAVVTGGIRLSELNTKRNPQYFWAGLIHEDVEISEFNSRVDPQQIEVIQP